jgi:hypothetical protein
MEQFCYVYIVFDLLEFVHKVTMEQLMDKDLFGGRSSKRVN